MNILKKVVKVFFLFVMFFSQAIYALNTQGLTLITSKELFEKYLDHKEYVLIDNRPYEKFAAGHIKGAINLVYFVDGDPQNTLTFESLDKVSKKKKIIFYCTGHNRAPNAAQTAIEKWKIPSNRVFLFKGGIIEWEGNNYPTSKD